MTSQNRFSIFFVYIHKYLFLNFYTSEKFTFKGIEKFLKKFFFSSTFFSLTKSFLYNEFHALCQGSK